MLRMVVMLIQSFDGGSFSAAETRASAAPPLASSPDTQGKDKGLDGDQNEEGQVAAAAATTSGGNVTALYCRVSCVICALTTTITTKTIITMSAPGGPVKQYEGIDGENMLWTEAYQVS